jgi:hypothetical protein
MRERRTPPTLHIYGRMCFWFRKWLPVLTRAQVSSPSTTPEKRLSNHTPNLGCHSSFGTVADSSSCPKFLGSLLPIDRSSSGKSYCSLGSFSGIALAPIVVVIVAAIEPKQARFPHFGGSSKPSGLYFGTRCTLIWSVSLSDPSEMGLVNCTMACLSTVQYGMK